MGLKIGRLFKSIVKSVPGAIVGAVTGGVPGAIAGAFSRKLVGGVGAGIPSIQEVTGAAPIFPTTQLTVNRPGTFADGTIGSGTPVRTGGMAPALPAVAGALRMSQAAIQAVVKLAASLGITVAAGSIARVGARIWRSVNALAKRHPGISIVSFLIGLGLTAQEAAEFLLWGQSRRRRRQGGISARDLRVTRRTLRRLSMFRSRVGLTGARRGRRGGRGSSGHIVVAQQD